MQVESRGDRHRPGRSGHSEPASIAVNPQRVSAKGMTLIELVITCAILIVLSTASLPVTRYVMVRKQEAELRYDLREMRDAIDRYKDLADKNQIQIKVGTEGYPPDLDTLVKGVQLAGAPDRHMRFLRNIPVDPMTGKTDWGMRSVQDDADSNSWGGQDVFDVFTTSTGTALDGTKYSDW
ncbi:MAG: type II secretion system protein [Candidatus Acidiferrales bacterium]